MRRLVVAVALLVGAAPVRAGPPPPVPAPDAARPQSPQEAAAAIESAVRASDDAAVAVLAARDEPDAWIVARLLAASGEEDAARAFAAARDADPVRRWRELGSDPDGSPSVGGLARYVEARLGQPEESAAADFVAAEAVLAAERVGDRGDPVAALAALANFASDDTVLSVRAATARGRALHALGRDPEAFAELRAAADEAEEAGWLFAAHRALLAASDVLADSIDANARVDVLLRAGHLSLRLGRSPSGPAVCESVAPCTHGGLKEAEPLFDRAVALLEATGEKARAAETLHAIFDARAKLWADDVDEALWDAPVAVALLERAAKIWHELSDPVREIDALDDAASALERAFDYRGAIAMRRAVLAVADRLTRERGTSGRLTACRTLEALAEDFARIGDRPHLLRTLERWADVAGGFASVDSVRLPGEAPPPGVDTAPDGRPFRALRYLPLEAISEFHEDAEDIDAAIENERRILAEHRRDRDGHAGETLIRIGRLLVRAGRPLEALAPLEEAGASAELADAYDALGDIARAARVREAWLRVADPEAQDYALVARRVKNRLATDYARLGRHEEARALIEPLTLTPLDGGVDDVPVCESIATRARVLLLAGDPQGAAAAALRALDGLDRAEAKVGAFEPRRFPLELATFDVAVSVGTLASVRAGDPARVFEFCERARARDLVTQLVKRRHGQRPRESTDSAALDARILAAEVRARARLDAARERGERAAIVEASTDLLAIEETERRVAEALDDVAIPPIRVDELRTVMHTLGADEAFVVYAFVEAQVIALVVTADEARVRSLGRSDSIEAACAALAIERPDGEHSSVEAIDALRRALVAPLELREATTRVIVAPDGPIAFVPFRLLVGGRDVAYAPSGTAYRLLREGGASRGEHVLALGDPDTAARPRAGVDGAQIPPAGRRLGPLPATAAEARAVGDVVLLGPRASLPGLRAALATRGRWRAIHFACHGLLDAERPTLSSLALTPTETDDGFLSVSQILRARFESDLVVLSACETAKGRHVRGEGIVGLTRAFLFSGSPRVLCSLWKVDDDATQALMTEFYRRWNPKDGSPPCPAASALEKAQAFVRAQERWKDPFYWAAWVLWGRAD